jgi:hypothetical protein
MILAVFSVFTANHYRFGCCALNGCNATYLILDLIVFIPLSTALQISTFCSAGLLYHALASEVESSSHLVARPRLQSAARVILFGIIAGIAQCEEPESTRQCHFQPRNALV